MKNYILASLILIVNLSFGQDKDILLHQKIFNSTVEENHYLTSSTFFSPFTMIKEIESIEPSNNSEGKFPIYIAGKKLKKETVGSENKSASLVLQSNSSFINNLVIKKLLENEKIVFFNTSLSYGDRAIESYRNHSELIEKINASYNFNDTLEIEIGNNIYPFLNKIYKSELDLTLQNSLNLLAINF